MRPWLWLYRPQVPSARAQAVQVLNAASAVAATGRPVTVLCEVLEPTTPAAVRAWFGLPDAPTLRLISLPRSRTLASIAIRARALAFVARHPDGVVLARDKRLARWLLRRAPRAHVVLEAHEVDSLRALEAGRDPTALRTLEAEVLAGSRAVVANAPGTLAALRRVHDLPRAAVIANATALRGPVPLDENAQGIGYFGSLHPDKDLLTLVRAAHRVHVPLTLVGPGDAAPLRAIGGGALRVLPAVAPARVGELYRRVRAVAVPLSDGLFGRELTSPLKLWDARASGRPVVMADLPAPRAVDVPALLAPPGEVEAWAHQLARAAQEPELQQRAWAAARSRTWADRAAELIDFVEGPP